MLFLILGGTRSGKSLVAEQIAGRLDEQVTYVATGMATDEDMAQRIARHQVRRPATWTTVESGDDLSEVLHNLDGTALVDGLGTWLARFDDFGVDTAALCAALQQRRGHTVVVSDEVGMGVHPSSEVGRRFRDALGSLNQAVADVADRVMLVVAGRVLELNRPVDLVD